MQTQRASGVVYQGKEIVANAFLIAPDLAIISGHSTGNSSVKLQFPDFLPFDGKVLIDGASLFNLDFKIVVTPNLGIRPAPLMVSKGAGISLQFSYGERNLNALLF